MAGGFWTGLGQGALAGAVVLAGVSLLAPPPAGMPPSGATAMPEVTGAPHGAPAPMADAAAADAAAADRTTGALPARITATAITAPADEGATSRPGPGSDPAAAPAAAPVELPIGSEFGRGGDVAPMLPAPLATPSPLTAQAEPPAVSRPADEPAPIALTGPDPRPRADLPATRTLTPQDAGAGASDLAPVADDAAPARGAVPDRLGPADRDAAPDLQAGSDAVPDNGDRSGDSTLPSAPPAGPSSGPQATTPALPDPELRRPSLDLSIPPALSQLPGMEPAANDN